MTANEPSTTRPGTFAGAGPHRAMAARAREREQG